MLWSSCCKLFVQSQVLRSCLLARARRAYNNRAIKTIFDRLSTTISTRYYIILYKFNTLLIYHLASSDVHNIIRSLLHLVIHGHTRDKERSLIFLVELNIIKCGAFSPLETIEGRKSNSWIRVSVRLRSEVVKGRYIFRDPGLYTYTMGLNLVF